MTLETFFSAPTARGTQAHYHHASSEACAGADVACDGGDPTSYAVGILAVIAALAFANGVSELQCEEEEEEEKGPAPPPASPPALQPQQPWEEKEQERERPSAPREITPMAMLQLAMQEQACVARGCAQPAAATSCAGGSNGSSRQDATGQVGHGNGGGVGEEDEDGEETEGAGGLLLEHAKRTFEVGKKEEGETTNRTQQRAAGVCQVADACGNSDAGAGEEEEEEEEQVKQFDGIAGGCRAVQQDNGVAESSLDGLSL
jgi:hypothetical protein